QHRKDHLAVLHGPDMARRERPAVAITVDVEDHGAVGPALPEEVAVERVRVPVARNRETGGPQRLRRHLPAEQPVPIAPYIEATEEIAVEDLEVEQLGQRSRDREFGHPSDRR